MKLLERRSSFNPAFSFGCAYAQAPNPILDITEVGVIGLPLSKRDAEAIKSNAHPATFGQGERSPAHRSTHETWEVNADQVYIQRLARPTGEI